MLFEIREVNFWKRAIISQHKAEEKAKLEYMTPKEREIWRNYFEILQKNTYARKMLKMKNEKLDRAIEELEDTIFYQSLSDKDYLNACEVYNILRHRYFTLKKEYEKDLELKLHLQSENNFSIKSNGNG